MAETHSPDMGNPWLTIPLHDYEEHMSSSHVQQLPALSELFGQALQHCSPESVALLGIAGGNGLERIDPAVTRRICGIDINPAYIEATRQRFAGLPGLELHCRDLEHEALDLPPMQLVHAALIFEHTGLHRCLDNACNLARGGGSLSVVLQLPARNPEQNISRNSRPSIETLRDHFQLIPPPHLRGSLEKRGFQMVWRVERPLPSGKGFWMGIFTSVSVQPS